MSAPYDGTRAWRPAPSDLPYPSDARPTDISYIPDTNASSMYPGHSDHVDPHAYPHEQASQDPSYLAQPDPYRQDAGSPSTAYLPHADPYRPEPESASPPRSYLPGGRSSRRASRRAEANRAREAYPDTAQPEPAPPVPSYLAEPEPAPLSPAYRAEPEPAPLSPAYRAEPEPAPVSPAYRAEPEPAPVSPSYLAEPEPAPVSPAPLRTERSVSAPPPRKMSTSISSSSPSPTYKTVADASDAAMEVLDVVSQAVVGKERPLRLMLAAILAGGHVLVEDYPGLGKTLAARSIAQALGLDFARAQFTPDLLPADLTGSFVYDQREGEFVFHEGPVFTGLLLADEINRTPPKTQAALLEAMQEGQVSIEGRTFQLPRPFHVVATANPVEYEGTYPLPEAQLDRFLLRVSFGYPTPEEEWGVLERRIGRRQEEQSVPAVLNAADLAGVQAAVETVDVDESIGRYCVALAEATRRDDSLALGASPRGSLALVLTARAYAVVDGRDYVTPEDVKAVAHAALDHRVTVRPELWMSDVTGHSVVASVLARVPGPDSGGSSR